MHPLIRKAAFVLAAVFVAFAAVAADREDNVIPSKAKPSERGPNFKKRSVTPKLPANPKTVTVAHWNLENLFDADDDPNNPQDDGYTPRGWAHWYKYRYAQKLTNIADIVSEMEPDILMVTEVENRRVLEDLNEILTNVFHWPMPEIAHKDSGDFRGIDNAVMSRYKPERVSWISHGSKARESVQVDFNIGGRPLTVIECHWKSRVGDTEKSELYRCYSAEKVRKAYMHMLHEDSKACVLVSGDFNDNINDRSTLEVAGFSTNITQVLNGNTNLFCLSTYLPKDKRGTYYYSQAKSWNSFDTINVTRGMLPCPMKKDMWGKWVVDQKSYRIFHLPRQCMDNGDDKDIPYPYSRVGTPTGHKFLNGYSDHFPVTVKLKAR